MPSRPLLLCSSDSSIPFLFLLRGTLAPTPCWPGGETETHAQRVRTGRAFPRSGPGDRALVQAVGEPGHSSERQREVLGGDTCRATGWGERVLVASSVFHGRRLSLAWGCFVLLPPELVSWPSVLCLPVPPLLCVQPPLPFHRDRSHCLRSPPNIPGDGLPSSLTVSFSLFAPTLAGPGLPCQCLWELTLGEAWSAPSARGSILKLRSLPSQEVYVFLSAADFSAALSKACWTLQG